MTETLSFAWRNLWRNPRRTLVTAGAIGLGLALFIVSTAYMRGFLDYMLDATTRGWTGEAQIHSQAYVDSHEASDTLPGGDALLPVRKLRSYIRQASIPLPERMESYNFIYRQPLDEMFEPEFLASVNPEIPNEMLRDAYFRADSIHPINQMLHLDQIFHQA